ncbi:hypothetical protein DXG01_014128, partial [Tephrocybe rancida]
MAPVVLPCLVVHSNWTNGSRTASPQKRKHEVHNPASRYKQTKATTSTSTVNLLPGATSDEAIEDGMSEMINEPDKVPRRAERSSDMGNNDYVYVDLVLSGGIGFAQIYEDVDEKAI